MPLPLFFPLRRLSRRLWVILLLATLLHSIPARGAEEDEEQYTGTVTSMDAMHSGGEITAGALRSSAQYALQHNQYNKAIKLIKMSLQKNYDDCNTHQVYAEALEQKLDSQEDKDPVLFNKCVKEWLIVLRQEVGDEKLTYHGIGVPGLGKFYEDEEFTIPAKQHLKTLTGYIPKVWETDAKFLSRVAKPDSTEVTGKVVRAPKKAAPAKIESDDE